MISSDLVAKRATDIMRGYHTNFDMLMQTTTAAILDDFSESYPNGPNSKPDNALVSFRSPQR
ncbi:hypothetical protein MBANPS3_002294 [Mucor bainieri]